MPEELRHRVLTAALDELSRWGVERFSIEAVAGRHGLDTASLYRYWNGPQRVLLDALQYWSSSYLTLPDSGSLRGDLKELALGVAEYFNTDLGRRILRGLVLDGTASYGDQTREIFWQQRFAEVRVILDNADARGELRAGIDQMAAVQTLLSPLTVRALYTELDITREYALALADLAWHGMRAGGGD
ncbi:MAG TPA: TetR/AcrR family transcriptional regulator C-terminal ligand-binding domain-containing protein [Mycobacterium sp.]|nr:TetR/AcrR family transcriptional regulator C-terminal ligand-binding domain-containing protein [Mycobacterium sp.]